VADDDDDDDVLNFLRDKDSSEDLTLINTYVRRINKYTRTYSGGSLPLPAQNGGETRVRKLPFRRRPRGNVCLHGQLSFDVTYTHTHTTLSVTDGILTGASSYSDVLLLSRVSSTPSKCVIQYIYQIHAQYEHSVYVT